DDTARRLHRQPPDRARRAHAWRPLPQELQRHRQVFPQEDAVPRLVHEPQRLRLHRPQELEGCPRGHGRRRQRHAGAQAERVHVPRGHPQLRQGPDFAALQEGRIPSRRPGWRPHCALRRCQL
ncbi:hypothetical protein BN1723_019970, partial [Verticillium longisporum]